MEELGKVDRRVFDEVLAPNLGADRDDVVLGPRHGVDFGVVDVGGRALVTATDPVSILPDLGLERAGRFALDVVLADVAVSGIAPSHLAIGLTLPPEMSDQDLAAAWRGIADRADDVGVSVVTGHTARYPSVSYPWVGAATVFGVGDHSDVIRPDGAKPGDAVVLTNGPGSEVAGLFASLFPEEIDLPSDVLAAASDRLDDAGVVDDVRAATGAGDVRAMHDATEGGVLGAFCEMAATAGVQFRIDADAVPYAPGVVPVCEALGLDPWIVSSAGSLVLTVASDDADDVVDAIREGDTAAAVVGSVTDGEGVLVDGERRSPPASDPAWDAFERLSDSE